MFGRNRGRRGPVFVVDGEASDIRRRGRTSVVARVWLSVQRLLNGAQAMVVNVA